MINQECKKYIDIWEKWQRSAAEQLIAAKSTKALPSESDKELLLTDEIREAIDHISACPECLNSVAEITVDAALNLTGNLPRAILVSFIEDARRIGFHQAIQRHPAISVRLAKNETTRSLAYAFKNLLIHDFAKDVPPSDVMFSVHSGIQSLDWVQAFVKVVGITKDHQLASQARLALEFYIESQMQSVAVNRRPIVAVMGPHALVQIGDDSFLSSLSRSIDKKADTQREIFVNIDKYKARISFDLSSRRVDIIMPKLTEYKTKIPKVFLLSEEANLVKTGMETEQGYTISFSGLVSGVYLMAIDVVDRVKAQKWSTEEVYNLKKKERYSLKPKNHNSSGHKEGL